MIKSIAELFYRALEYDLPDALAAKAGGAYVPLSHREVQARVAAATPFLLDPLARRVAVSRGNIHAAAYELEGETLVMAANTSDHCAGALTFGGKAADLPLAPNQSGFYRVRHGVWTAR